ncbi:MAG: hypothetical protein IPH46_04970 [Bacteroidetes bacterium]|nr:hypothetical protein [Bacteroidota bacterium]
MLSYDRFYYRINKHLTLLVGVIGYFIKSIYSLSIKKQETNHVLLQQQKLGALEKFFDAYVKTLHMWQDLPYYEIVERMNDFKDPKEIDKLIWGKMNELNKTIWVLYLYFDAETFPHFREVYNSFEKINKVLLYEWNQKGNYPNNKLTSEFWKVQKNK